MARMPGFIGPSYTLDSKNVDCQRTVNLYPELNEIGTGKEKEVAALKGTPGKRTLLTLPTLPVRGEWTASSGEVFAVGGDKLYQISDAWIATELGSLATSSGPVSIADNGDQVVVVDGISGYVWTISTSTYAQISDPDFPICTQVTYQDGYFLFIEKDTQRFIISGLASVDFDALDFASAEGSPDDLVAIISDHQNVYLLGSRSSELWYNAGSADFPFARQQGAFIEVGCAAAFSVAKLGGAVFWLGQDETGRGIVYRAQGFQPQRISTHAIENVILRLGDVSSARAWVYQQGGHSFYVLNLPGAETTWVFDTTTNLWHERSYLRAGSYERDRADCHAFAHGQNIVGDYENGKIYALDPDYYSDDGTEIVRERSAPHITKELRRVIHHYFQLDMETGVGLDGIGQGTAPVAILDWSDDGGQTWSNEKIANIGPIGARSTRVIWRRLGSSRDRVYRVRITDPVKVTFIGADLGLEETAA